MWSHVSEPLPGRSVRSVAVPAADLLVYPPEQVSLVLAPSAWGKREIFLQKQNVCSPVMAVHPLLLQIFNELDQAGSLLAKETLEDALPMHDGKGDVRKCPYYAAKPDRGRSCLC